MSLGERVKEARLKKGLTQDELGEALGGLTGPAISSIEKGIAKTFRDPKLFLEVAKILEVSPIWLQFGLGDAELITETVPLIDWEDVKQLPVRPSMIKRRLGTTLSVSPKSYALKVIGNSMTAQNGNETTFKEGAIIIVDPEVTPKPNSFVVVSHDGGLMLRKLVQDGGKQYLQPLNRLFQQETVNSKTKFYGVVRSILIEDFSLIT
ncbi:MAG: helix-turn-helix domain-containing protein [Proteobacteria bacterium]|nr:helix-turn-helix domain-containing protein [Pseudomonadota bacterium]